MWVCNNCRQDNPDTEMRCSLCNRPRMAERPNSVLDAPMLRAILSPSRPELPSARLLYILAPITFIIILLSGIIMFISVIVTSSQMSRYGGGISFWIPLAILVFSILGSVVSYVALRGFGDLVQSSHNTSKHMETLARNASGGHRN